MRIEQNENRAAAEAAAAAAKEDRNLPVQDAIGNMTDPMSRCDGMPPESIVVIEQIKENRE